ncbi:MAG: hypothetical protein P4M08_13180 [Oligoflexia bacterium]|nr:hypothetical protein [Oligoflexia bacterium]
MKNLNTLFIFSALFLSTLCAKAVLADESSNLSPSDTYWCGTEDRELEVKTYPDRVVLINPSAENGPAVIMESREVKVINTPDGTLFKSLSTYQTREQVERPYFISTINPNDVAAFRVFISPSLDGWISIKQLDGSVANYDLTCIAN